MTKGNFEQGLKKMIDSIDVSPDVAFNVLDINYFFYFYYCI